MTGSGDQTSRPLRPWAGETYYGRPQLKPAPFDPWVVGGYVFLAGLSGSSALIGALAGATAPRRPHRADRSRAGLVRRSRYLSLLAPTIGSALLIYDLHTPQRFYNMLRVAKRTSPMSIGTWILMGFSACAGACGLAQMTGDVKPRWRRPRRIAAAAQIPAAVAGAGLSTYTAALLSATSTPLWAAAPRATAARFAASSVASAAAALSLGEASTPTRGALAKLMLVALTTELTATVATNERIKAAGIESGRRGGWSNVETIGATGLGAILPIGLLLADGVARRRSGGTTSGGTTAASLLTLAGSALMRVSVLGAGAASARRPEVSMRFAQPDNLPKGR